jgi:predicted dehydrogenase
MTVGWGIIGTGWVSSLVAQCIKTGRNTKLVAVVSRSKESANKFAAEYGISGAYNSLEEMLHNPEVEAVYVGTPNDLHATQTMQAAEAGKHVLCEKPMAPTVTECRSMIEVCKRHGVKLGINYDYRQHPAHIKAREIIASGELGRVINVNSQVCVRWQPRPAGSEKWFYRPGMVGHGAMSRIGVHRLDMMRFLLGQEAVEVGAYIGEVTGERPFEETGVVMLRFEKGVLATLHFSIEFPHGNNDTEINGSKASLFMTGATLWSGQGGELHLKSDAIFTKYQFEKTDMYRDSVEVFSKCIEDNTQPPATGMDGLRVAQICAAMFESINKKKIIELELGS